MTRLKEMAIFIWEDGSTREVLMHSDETPSIRGLKRKGKRPIKLLYTNYIDDYTMYTLLCALDPKGTREPLYKPLDKYVVLSGNLHELHYSKHNNKYVLMFGKETMWYDSIMDGETLTREEASDKYPEYFV